MSLNEDKSKAIDVAVTQIERQFGKGAIMKLGEGAKVKFLLDRFHSTLRSE